MLIDVQNAAPLPSPLTTTTTNDDPLCVVAGSSAKTYAQNGDEAHESSDSDEPVTPIGNKRQRHDSSERQRPSSRSTVALNTPAKRTAPPVKRTARPPQRFGQ